MAKFKQSRRDLSKRASKRSSNPRIDKPQTDRPQTDRPRTDKPKPAASATKSTRTNSGKPDSDANVSRNHKSGYLWLYGTHATLAAIDNPIRKFQRLLVTRQMADTLQDHLQGHKPPVHPEICDRKTLDDILPAGAVHQGIAVLVKELDDPGVLGLCRQFGIDTDDAPASVCVVILDQATDPRNVGAVMRSAAAFGARAVIIQDRHGPETGGVLAKAASGALESIPLIRETNLSRAISNLKDAGFWTVGLDGSATQNLGELDLTGRIALILGSEGSGLRRLVKENCDHIAKIPIHSDMESLNLSNAAAIALYETVRPKNI